MFFLVSSSFAVQNPSRSQNDKEKEAAQKIQKAFRRFSDKKNIKKFEKIQKLKITLSFWFTELLIV